MFLSSFRGVLGDFQSVLDDCVCYYVVYLMFWVIVGIARRFYAVLGGFCVVGVTV